MDQHVVRTDADLASVVNNAEQVSNCLHVWAVTSVTLHTQGTSTRQAFDNNARACIGKVLGGSAFSAYRSTALRALTFQSDTRTQDSDFKYC